MPFIFKNLVDTLSDTSQAAAEAGLTGVPLEAAAAVPFAMVLGYGIARSTASGAQEVRLWVYRYYCSSTTVVCGISFLVHKYNSSNLNLILGIL